MSVISWKSDGMVPVSAWLFKLACGAFFVGLDDLESVENQRGRSLSLEKWRRITDCERKCWNLTKYLIFEANFLIISAYCCA
ncbi:hypothetical protein ERO13_A06G048566v2 [Gossypium hirsutum]|uniref:Uncharacterized protein n=2 Tax=Gossypium TaxID=3633 RepID=A0A5J5T1J7_GOSBA|nr:hypothetical protein ES319_D10G226900v1 [Gossypium barbadense]KAG4166809.1 hypothetical protein ERO13_A13G155650v2 [Gossypium hirsutum]TYI61349.1 hypothetical protein E1A91_D10G166600v1 [Gossypium mustelinum]KAB2013588.1 hypothetical protein ES319_D09G165900v1 [Gossypium barbadense]KAB2025502.1 hypothetical protein ES319_D06G153600v1 [Gossypium barbadense]